MSIYDTLNKEQREAVCHTEGPLLILAGAGSGKTRVITHRIAYLIGEKGVHPWNIMAITFTNKAAGEMRCRVDDLVGYEASSVWVATFHSSCVRMLRQHIERIGFGSNFTIYDRDDQKKLMKNICKDLKIDTKQYKEAALLHMISSAKNDFISPARFEQLHGGEWEQKRKVEVYHEYQKRLRSSNALDFDDLLVKAVELLQACPDVLEYYQNRFHYIMVDEYQDTNMVQFKFVSLLAGSRKNVCVVGDDDQSIYKFRGADISNILDFEKIFPNACVIRLEQNYRSTANILEAANSVISNNTHRKAKRLWTDRDGGDKIVFRQLQSSYEEAQYIAESIRDRVSEGLEEYRDCAILYRTNAQARALEEKFILMQIPYKVFGGVNFYARKEIKDLLAYLKTIDNGADDIAVLRIINEPRRGIGQTTIARLQEYALMHEMSFFQACVEAADNPAVARASSKIQGFVRLIQDLRECQHDLSLRGLVEELMQRTGYVQELEAEETEEAEARIENIDEFMAKVIQFEEEDAERDADEETYDGVEEWEIAGAGGDDATDEAEDGGIGGTGGLDGVEDGGIGGARRLSRAEDGALREVSQLSRFLEEVSLVADIDALDADSSYVALMTIHSAKGLEFPHVYLSGLEDGVFPGYMSITADDPLEIEEERRLCYVAITRAQKRLTVTAAQQRFLHGEVQYNKVSRFLQEMPVMLLDTNYRARTVQNNDDQPLPFRQAKTVFQAKPFVPKQFQVTRGEKPDYVVGDRVRHMKFGEGTVRQIVSGGADYEVTVEFDRVGTKKMFSQYAKLKKI